MFQNRHRSCLLKIFLQVNTPALGSCQWGVGRWEMCLMCPGPPTTCPSGKVRLKALLASPPPYLSVVPPLHPPSCHVREAEAPSRSPVLARPVCSFLPLAPMCSRALFPLGEPGWERASASRHTPGKPGPGCSVGDPRTSQPGLPTSGKECGSRRQMP